MNHFTSGQCTSAHIFKHSHSGSGRSVEMSVRWFVSCAVFVGWSSIVRADDSLGKGTTEAYSFTQPVQVQRCELSGDRSSPPEVQVAPARAAFYVVTPAQQSSNQGDVLIQFLDWSSKGDNKKYRERFNYTPKDEIKYWCVDRGLATKTTREYRFKTPLSSPNIGVGLLVVPIKLRPFHGASFTTDVSLGPALDLSWQVAHDSDMSIHLPVFAGIGAAEIKPNESTLSEARAVPTFSLGVGLGFASANAGAGIVIGVDTINDNRKIKWKQQFLPWIGFSIGATFGVKPSTAEQKESQ